MSSVPRTALPGWSRSSAEVMAKGLGYLSLALGATEVLLPRTVAAAAGLENHGQLIRAFGLREIATGAAILNSHDATPWVVGRVIGDAADLMTVAVCSKKMTQTRTMLSFAMLTAVSALDALCASRLYAEKGRRTTAHRDYRDRSGFPRGLEAARGIARGQAPPRDMRTPGPLQAWGVERESAADEHAGGDTLATTAPAASI